MTEVLRYLELKNFWFKKFLLSCEQFLEFIKKEGDVSIENLDLFESNRSRLLKIIKRTEERLQQSLQRPVMQGTVLNSEQKTKINYHLREKDSILAQILATDTQILEIIDRVKNETDSKIKSLSKGKKALSKYKSTVRYSDNLDKQV